MSISVMELKKTKVRPYNVLLKQHVKRKAYKAKCAGMSSRLRINLFLTSAVFLPSCNTSLTSTGNINKTQQAEQLPFQQ